jgi:hypothetical protein
MYVLLCGYLPFYGKKQGEVFEKIKNRELKFDQKEW